MDNPIRIIYSNIKQMEKESVENLGYLLYSELSFVELLELEEAMKKVTLAINLIKDQQRKG